MATVFKLEDDDDGAAAGGSRTKSAKKSQQQQSRRHKKTKTPSEASFASDVKFKLAPSASSKKSSVESSNKSLQVPLKRVMVGGGGAAGGGAADQGTDGGDLDEDFLGMSLADLNSTATISSSEDSKRNIKIVPNSSSSNNSLRSKENEMDKGNVDL